MVEAGAAAAIVVLGQLFLASEGQGRAVFETMGRRPVGGGPLLCQGAGRPADRQSSATLLLQLLQLSPWLERTFVR